MNFQSLFQSGGQSEGHKGAMQPQISRFLRLIQYVSRFEVDQMISYPDDGRKQPVSVILLPPESQRGTKVA